jgi:hypothetical protein
MATLRLPSSCTAMDHYRGPFSSHQSVLSLHEFADSDPDLSLMLHIVKTDKSVQLNSIDGMM